MGGGRVESNDKLTFYTYVMNFLHEVNLTDKLQTTKEKGGGGVVRATILSEKSCGHL